MFKNSTVDYSTFKNLCSSSVGSASCSWVAGSHYLVGAWAPSVGASGVASMRQEETVGILDSVFWGETTYLRVNLMHFFYFCVCFECFSGGEFGILGGKIPPEDSWK